MVLLGEEGQHHNGREDTNQHQARPPRLVAISDAPPQKPVADPAVGVEVPVFPQVGSPGDGYLASFGVLPGLLVDGRELLIGLGGELGLAVRGVCLVLARIHAKRWLAVARWAPPNRS